MPFGSVILLPGVNVERTPTLLQAAVSESQFIRYKDSLIQKLGGWAKYCDVSVAGVPRDLHAWQDLNSADWLSCGTTTQLGIIDEDCVLTDITPQTFDSEFSPDFTTSAASPTVTIVDPNIANVTTNDFVYFETPISVDTIILSGLYAIVEVTGATSYQITAATNGAAGVTSGGAVPVFTTTADDATVNVEFADHGLAVGDTFIFPIATTGNGVTISGAYQVTVVVDADNFRIEAANEATASSSFSMNGGNAQLLYYLSQGPIAVGVGFGLGGYGEGGFGLGVPSSSSMTGTPITATNWTSDNWGEILVTCPTGGGIYQYDPNAGFQNARLITNAPVFNTGIFISIAQQIIVAFGSTAVEGIGVQLDPLLIRWCSVGDFNDWTASTENQAGSRHLPTGSAIKAGAAVSNQNLVWTDIDLWAMNYIGPPFVFGFNKIGSGAGAASLHSVQMLRGNVYWMGQKNFYQYTSGGVAVIPCPIWDVVFQNINTAYLDNICALPNTPFNEVGWCFPSSASADGEPDTYVKFNITEPNQPWDYGSYARSAWIDQTLLGPPIAATPTGIIYQHETSEDDDGNPLMSSFTTGYFYIAEGEEFAFVDQILPDFKFGEFGGSSAAQIQISFNVINYTDETPITYGPYTVTSETSYLAVRFRGRQMSITVASSDTGSFWRIGRVRYRWSMAGRR